MVEVALALGVIAFALLSVVALLPIGVKSNQISAEETRATGILTLLEADLRNTSPTANQGKSLLFGLVLPYDYDPGSGERRLTAPSTNNLSIGNSTGLDEDETPVALSAKPRPRYQASVIYTKAPPSGFAPLEARLIVNWPAVDLSDPSLSSEDKKIAALTDPSKTSGYVEAYVTFPAP